MVDALRDAGCTQVFIKILAENDNSKNQIYFGSDFTALNQFPVQEIAADRGGVKGPIFKAALNFGWVNSDGEVSTSPHAQLILYPQYPEVRFSGFLKGSKRRPSAHMNERRQGRVLLMGVADDGRILGHVVAPNSVIGREIQQRPDLEQSGVFSILAITAEGAAGDTKEALLHELERIHSRGWIRSKRLDSQGNTVDCNAPNCGGYTLEAELGLTPSGDASPDYLGWELKSFKVNGADDYTAPGAITLMTPEPTGGYYRKEGVIDFVRKFGYLDTQGRSDRMNFGSVHRVGQANTRTGLTLRLRGFDSAAQKIVNSSGSIALQAPSREIAASWDFASIMRHWNRKHAQAAYVPRQTMAEPELRFSFGHTVGLGEGTDFLKLLSALDAGLVYYDPGIRVTAVSSAEPKSKRRSQFRIRGRDVPGLYTHYEYWHLDASHGPMRFNVDG